jgi:putative transposase
VDQHGVVLDILVQERRNATAAKRFFKPKLDSAKRTSDERRCVGY